METIAGYQFERISEDSYRVVQPDGEVVIKYYLAAESLMRRLQKKVCGETKPVSELYPVGTTEWHKLQAFADLLNGFQSLYFFTVENCYKDAGTGVGWTTVVARRCADDMSFQFFTPLEQRELLSASFTEYVKMASATLSRIKKTRM